MGLGRETDEALLLDLTRQLIENEGLKGHQAIDIVSRVKDDYLQHMYYEIDEMARYYIEMELINET